MSKKLLLSTMICVGMFTFFGCTLTDDTPTTEKTIYGSAYQYNAPSFIEMHSIELLATEEEATTTEEETTTVEETTTEVETETETEEETICAVEETTTVVAEETLPVVEETTPIVVDSFGYTFSPDDIRAMAMLLYQECGGDWVSQETRWRYINSAYNFMVLSGLTSFRNLFDCGYIWYHKDFYQNTYAWEISYNPTYDNSVFIYDFTCKWYSLFGRDFKTEKFNSFYMDMAYCWNNKEYLNWPFMHWNSSLPAGYNGAFYYDASVKCYFY